MYFTGTPDQFRQLERLPTFKGMLRRGDLREAVLRLRWRDYSHCRG